MRTICSNTHPHAHPFKHTRKIVSTCPPFRLAVKPISSQDNLSLSSTPRRGTFGSSFSGKKKKLLCQYLAFVGMFVRVVFTSSNSTSNFFLEFSLGLKRHSQLKFHHIIHVSSSIKSSLATGMDSTGIRWGDIFPGVDGKNNSHLPQSTSTEELARPDWLKNVKQVDSGSREALLMEY